jgi:hypothetical protein
MLPKSFAHNHKEGAQSINTAGVLVLRNLGWVALALAESLVVRPPQVVQAVPQSARFA